MEVNPFLKSTEVQNPFPNSTKVQNPSPDFANSAEISGGSIGKTLESEQVPLMVENPITKIVDVDISSDGNSSELINKTLEIEQVPTIKETPVPEIVEVENPPPDSGKSNEISGGSIAKTLDSDVVEEIVVKSVEEIPECEQFGSPDLECSEILGISDESFFMLEKVECSQFNVASFSNCGNGFGDRGWSKPEPCPVGAGLSNMGNTCFLNVVVQCITHTVPFVEGLLSLKHEASSHGQDEFCVLCAVRDQVERSLAFSGNVISPFNLVDNLNNISSCFQRYQQEDAHEFLQCLFDKLDSNWSKREPNAVKLPSSHDSLIKQVFGGCLVSQLSCCKCGNNSDIYEPMNNLSLEIEDVDNLESALKSFTKVENLEDTSNCDRCQEKVERKKRLLLDQAPLVAALHLKRFKSDGTHVEKIDRMVKYPLQLDLEPFTKGARDDNEDAKYDLYGFVVHVGLSSTSGHYFCYMRTSPDAWYCFDDLKVTKVSEETALEQEAYILLYAKKGTPWFSDLVEKWKTLVEEKLNTSPKSVLYSQDFDKRDTSPVTYAEPLCCRRLDDVKKVAEVDTQVSAGEFNRNNESPTNFSYGDEHKTPKPSLETSFVSNVDKHIDDVFKFDLEPGSPDIYSDNEPPAVSEVRYKIPVEHLKIPVKVTTTLLTVVRNSKQDVERKEAVKYVKSSSMPIGRRQRLMAALDASQSEDLSPSLSATKKRSKHSSMPRKRHRISCR